MSVAWGPRAKRARTLLLAIGFDEMADDELPDADLVADNLLLIVNEERTRNGGYGGPLTVSAIPAPQWLTPETLRNLRAAAANTP